jgi:hypothetical protein
MNNVTNILEFPGDVLVKCFSFLEEEDLNRCRVVHSIFKAVIDYKNFGEKLYGKDFWDLKMNYAKEKDDWEKSVIKNSYKALKLIFKLFEERRKFYELPELKIDDERKGKEYLDFIQPGDVNFPITRGSANGRLFFVIRVKREYKPKKDVYHEFLSMLGKEELQKLDAQEELKNFNLKKNTYSAPICQTFFQRYSSAFAGVGAKVILLNGYLIDYGQINSKNKQAYKDLRTLISEKKVTVKDSFHDLTYTYVLC